MKFPLKRAGHSIGSFLGLISLIICIIAPCATGISSANKNPIDNRSVPEKIVGQQATSQFNGTHMDTLLAQMPLRFEQNVGQFAKPVEFLCRGNGYELTAAPQQVVVKLEKAQERKWKGSEEVVGDCERLKLPPSAFCLAPSSSQISSHSTTSREAITEVENPLPSAGQTPAELASSSNKTTTLRLKFLGSKATAQVAGLHTLATKSHYFIGNQPKDWRTDVASFASVKYTGLYDGVDAVIYGNQQNPEYDFIVAAGADFQVIQLAFEGAKSIKIDEQGDLLLETDAGLLRQRKPFAYQTINGERREIACNYTRLNPKTSPTPTRSRRPTADACRGARPCAPAQTPLIGFEIGDYDKTLPLVIDPILDFSSQLGGGGGLSYNVTDVALDADANIYLVGHTYQAPVPASESLQTQAVPIHTGIFVAKINSASKQLVYYTTLASLSSFSYNEITTGIAVDAAGSAYITGYTYSTSFPTTPGAFQPTLQGNANAFVTKLSPDGNSLVYSTLLGAADSSGSDSSPSCNSQCITRASDIALDAAGNAYVTGETSSGRFPTTANAFKTVKSDDKCSFSGSSSFFPCTEAFVSKLNSAGSALIYSTFLGGNGNDSGAGIKVDAGGNAYVVGTTVASDFPVQNALYGSAFGGQGDAFLAKLNAPGSALLFSTYLGGNSREIGKAIDLDAAGNVYISGETGSTDLPTTAAVFQGKSLQSYLYKSTDGGASWKSLVKSPPIQKLAVDPNNSANLFAGTIYGIYQSTDGGDSWRLPSSKQQFFTFLTFAPQNPAVAFATAQENSGFSLSRTTDAGSTWTKIAYPKIAGNASQIYDLQVDPTDLSTFYLAHTSYEKIAKTSDAGATWKFLEEGLAAQGHSQLLGINAKNPALLFAQTVSLYRSKDGGVRWKATNLTDTPISLISFNPTTADVMYGAGGASLFGSTDSGMNWARIDSNLTSYAEQLVIAANSLYAVSDGAIFKSADGGKVWTNISSPASLKPIVRLITDPKNPSTLYATSNRFETDGFVMKLNPQASALLYCTYLGGDSFDTTAGISVDGFGNASVIGSTYSLDFPTRNAIQAKAISTGKAFVTKLNPAGDAVYSTYFGGNYSDQGSAIATDKNGSVYIVGTTFSNQFPQISPLQPAMGFASFVARIVDIPAAQSPPTVLSVTPDSGVAVRDTRVTIKGANFQQGATASIGGSLGQQTVVVDANTIQTTVVGGFGGPANVVVMNPDGQVGMLERSFNFLLSPLITMVTIENQRLVVYGLAGSVTGPGGFGFDAGAVLLINGKEVKTDPGTVQIILRSKKALKKIQPGQTAQLQVRNGSGILSNIFTYRRP
jgi:photosystem II stability/assembly factor-like uncharacterized protein